MRTLPLFLLLLAGCSGGDPWPGRYIGSTVTEGEDCDTGEPTSDAQDSTIRIERDAEGLFINGRCLLRLDELSNTSARVIPASCDVASPSGTPSHVEIVEGRAGLDGDELALEYSALVTQPGVCLTASSTFVGERE
jgi:hypothetical protein